MSENLKVQSENRSAMKDKLTKVLATIITMTMTDKEHYTNPVIWSEV